MPSTIPKPSIDVQIYVRWPGGERTFNLALTHEAILASGPADALLAIKLQETVRVPFEHWRKLDIQLSHLWSSGQSQEIYSHTSSGDYTATQEQVVELLSWWQQYACLETRSVRMVLNLTIDPEAVYLLPARAKALSLTQNMKDVQTLTRTCSPTKISVPRPIPDAESEVTFKTTVYERLAGADADPIDEDPVPQQHVVFDRDDETWNRLVFSRVSSRET